MPKILDENIYDAVDPGLAAKMHKAIAVIQFKVEEAMMQRHPEYEMENRMLLTAVDYKKGTVTIEGKEYPMLDMNFPTIDPRNPLELTRGEKELLRTLCASFRHSEVLQRQVKFIYSHGGIYKCYNSNLLYHGCIPMTKDGAFDTIMIGGNGYKGKSLMDFLNRQVHNAYFLPDGADGKEEALDLMWYLWCGARSPVFGKSKMTTFEHYFVEDKATHKEVMNPYYKLCEKVEICDKILEEFGLKTEGSHIINGHVPVKLKDGEKPVKAGGKLFVIDGGLTEATIVTATSEKFYEEHPELVKAFLTAQKQVLDEMDADHAAAVSATAKATGLEEAAVEEMYGLYDFDMEIKDSDIEAMEKTEKFMEDTGMIENPVDVASLILDVE